MPTIQDVIIHGEHKQVSIVLDKMPEFIYEKKGEYLLFAEDDSFYESYAYERSAHAKAFAGREFDIPMKDGSIIKANGQWWDSGIRAATPEDITQVGINTLDGLKKCYVFFSAKINATKLNKWLENNKASADHWKYDERTLAARQKK